MIKVKVIRKNITVGAYPIGLPGSRWRSGTGAPSNSLGINNDYYLDNVTGSVYIKTAGAYVFQTNIIGPAGINTWGSITGMLANQTDLVAALSGLLPYSGAIQNLDMGAFHVLTGRITGGTLAGSSIDFFGTTGVGVGNAFTFRGGNNGATMILTLLHDGTIRIPNNRQIQGADSAGTNRSIISWSSGDNISLIGRPGVTDIVLNPTVSGAGLYVKSNGDIGLGSASPSARAHIIKTTEQLRIGYDTNNYQTFTVNSFGGILVSSNASTSGAVTSFSFTAPNNTGQTIGTEIPGFKYNSRTIQWLTGAIPAQSEFLIMEPTYNSVAASTMAIAGTLVVNNAPQQTGNLTITAPYAIWVKNGNSLFEGSISLSGNRFIGSTNSAFSIRSNNIPRMAFTTNGATSFTQTAETTGASVSFTFTKPNNTGQTASTNINGFLFTTGSRQYLNGAIALQEEFVITGPTYSHVSGSNTITTAGTLNVYAPTTTGGFTIITNPFAIISNGNVNIKSSATGTALLVEGTAGVSQLITVKNLSGNTGLSMDAGLKAYFYGGGGITYPVVSSGADNNTGLGFATTQVSLVVSNVARLTMSGANMGFNGTSFGTGTGVLFVGNATVNPSTNPVGGGVIYVEAGALKYRGSSGTVTILGNA